MFTGRYLYVPCLEIEPATLANQGDALTNRATRDIFIIIIFYKPVAHRTLSLSKLMKTNILQTSDRLIPLLFRTKGKWRNKVRL